MIEKIKWLGHSIFRIDSEKIIYIDPWKIKKDSPQADIILITHDHYDHCSPEDVNRISKKESVVVTNKSCAVKLHKKEIKSVKLSDKINVYGIEIEIVPAYNINKPFHPKSAEGLGFIITVSGQRIYHSGDTDLIPEMEKIKCDIALLPISGTYVMTVEEAVKAVEIIKPKIAIPMHYGDIIGNINDAHRFADLCRKLAIEVRIPN